MVINIMNLLADNKVQWVLDKRNMTQTELAERLNIYQSDVSDIILGKRKRLTLVMAAKIAVELGYSVEFLWPSLFK